MSAGHGVKLLLRLHGTGDSSRKERSDAGQSILTNEEYRDSHVTPFSMFKKNSLAGEMTTGTGRKMDAKQLKSEFDLLLPAAKVELQQQVKEEKNNIANARKEIDDLLIKCEGEITYENIRRNIKAQIGVNAVRTYVMGLEGFSYAKTTDQPWLTAEHKAKMVVWARQFWIFWRSAKIMKLKIMLLHQDEKVSPSLALPFNFLLYLTLTLSFFLSPLQLFFSLFFSLPRSGSSRAWLERSPSRSSLSG